jgi:dTDP-glucose pyrophosphorylase
MADTGTIPRQKIQAILLATSTSDAFGTIVEHVPVEMMPLANKPFIGRVVGFLVGLSIKDITVLASHRVDLLSTFLGDGSRWGARIKVVALGSEAQALARLPSLATADFTLLADASVLPHFTPETLQQGIDAGGCHVILPGGAPSGWLLLARGAYGDAFRECKTMQDLEQMLARKGLKKLDTAAPVLRSSTPAELLQASRAIFDGQRPDQLVPGASAEKDVYISHSVVIHPTAHVTPPVLIGSHCSIERGAQIGPYAIVGERTILGAHTTLDHAIVFPGTYVGPHLELSHVVVDHHSLAYPDGKGAVPVPDPFLLSANEALSAGAIVRELIRRVLGGLLLLLLSPLLVFVYVLGRLMRVRNPLRTVQAVCLPAEADPALWQTFRYIEFDTSGRGSWQRLVRALRLGRLPTLWNITWGEAAWIGLRPLTADAISALPTDWRQMYRAGKVGIVRLSELDQKYATEDLDDQIYSSEAYYVMTGTVKTDLHIFWRALWRR